MNSEMMTNILMCHSYNFEINKEEFQHSNLFCPECGDRLDITANNSNKILGNNNELLLPPPIGKIPDTTNPLCGVGGWLKFIVVANLYIVPVVFAISQILAWIGYIMVIDKYPGIIASGIINTLVSGVLVLMGIEAAKGLRNIQPGAVKNVKALLKSRLTWTFISIPVAFLSGIDIEALMPGILKSVVAGVAGFTIWYSYFNVSKRVEATYSDWKD